ncbi:S8 family serine peptidase [Novosphingobium aquiterrae]|uniref:S8 family serine peptidase n=1 Tax=Novosphingobium aquiterrae TaxID=624388 RepID=A0ABV6PJF3_9SPHN
MQPLHSTLIAGFLAALAAPLAAQLALPQLPAVPPVGGTVDAIAARAGNLTRASLDDVGAALRQARTARIDDLLRRNRQTIERDADGQPARRGTLLVLDPGEADRARLAALGFTLRGSERLDDLSMTVVELTVPAGLDLAAAQRLVAKTLPGLTVSSDPLHFQSGGAASLAAAEVGAGQGAITTPIGLIDGAPAQQVDALRGFAAGAPLPSNHGSAVVSLATRAGVRTIRVADVYGNDPAGGNALAIVRGMNWLIAGGARVISISLVGPRNPVLERAVGAARARQVLVVAAVGNDGPAAPPSYPASYGGVVAVTAVDRRNRPLIEAGRALHLDYAAPGADITARNAAGRLVAVRGTSYAVPLVAARAAAAFQRGVAFSQIGAALDAEARPLARKLPDPRSGRGLLCDGCR